MIRSCCEVTFYGIPSPPFLVQFLIQLFELCKMHRFIYCSIKCVVSICQCTLHILGCNDFGKGEYANYWFIAPELPILTSEPYFAIPELKLLRIFPLPAEIMVSFDTSRGCQRWDSTRIRNFSRFGCFLSSGSRGVDARGVCVWDPTTHALQEVLLGS